MIAAETLEKNSGISMLESSQRLTPLTQFCERDLLAENRSLKGRQ